MTQWRSAQKEIKFGPVDARAAIPLATMLLVWNWWVLGIALSSLVLFGLMEFKGYTVPAALRAFRSYLAGPVRPRVPLSYWRRRIKYEV